MTPRPALPDFGILPLEWGARIDYTKWPDAYTPDEGIAVHYGGGANIAGDAVRAAGAGFAWPSLEVERFMLRRWEALHLGKGWRGLAYGFAIGQSGRVYIIRGWASYGAHLGDVDGDGISNNKEQIPVVFILGKGQLPTELALAAFRRLREHMEIVTGRRSSRHLEPAEFGTDGCPGCLYLRGHREVQGLNSTSCPGINSMMPMVTSNRHNLGGSPDPDPPTPPPTEGETVAEKMPVLRRVKREDGEAWPAEGAAIRDTVRIWQAILAINDEIDTGEINFPPPTRTADGLFGTSTEAATVSYQRKRGLVADGVVGDMTWDHGLGLA